jgi:hypothetical protein
MDLGLGAALPDESEERMSKCKTPLTPLQVDWLAIV